MATDASLMTADQLLAMPTDGYRYELVRGELVQMSPAGRKHGSIGESFSAYFAYHVLKHRLGEVYSSDTGFLLARNPDTVRAPDFSYIRQDRLTEIVGIDGYIPIPPDLCVEVVSPNDRRNEVEEKVGEWLDFGTQIVIVIQPKNRTTSIYRSHSLIEILSESETLRLEDILPGWSLSLAEIFR
jgi:Uma2 family endonuclease